MSAADLVFADGDRVLAMGRLVRDAKDWWLDSQRVITLASRAAGGRSQRSTRLLGGEAHVAALRKQDPAAVRLWVHVIGTWRRGEITVEAIGAGPGRPDRPEAADTVRDTAPERQAQLAQIAATFDANAAQWSLERWQADAIDDEGVQYSFVELFRVTPELARWADVQPDGLVLLDPSVRRLPK